MKKIKKLYLQLTTDIPDWVLHFSVNYIVAIMSPILAIGLSVGRESVRIPQLDEKHIRKDTLKDLLADGVGILLGILTVM